MKNAKFKPEFKLMPLTLIRNLLGAVFLSRQTASVFMSPQTANPSGSPVNLPRTKVAALISPEAVLAEQYIGTDALAELATAKQTRRPGLASRWKDPHRVHIG